MSLCALRWRRQQRTCNSLRPDGVETELTTVKRTRNTTTENSKSRSDGPRFQRKLYIRIVCQFLCRCVLLQPPKPKPVCLRHSLTLPLHRGTLSLSYLYLSRSRAFDRSHFLCAFAFAFVRKAKRHVNWLLVVRATTTSAAAAASSSPSPSSFVVVSACP